MVTEKLRLELPTALPKAADACGRCVDSLITVLRGRSDVSEVHLSTGPAGAETLCIHFDPTHVSFDQLRAFALEAGMALDDEFGHFKFHLGGVIHPRGTRRIAELLRQQSGVIQAEVDPNGLGFVEFDRSKTDEPQLRTVLRARGGRFIDDAIQPPVHDYGEDRMRTGLGEARRLDEDQPAPDHGDAQHGASDHDHDHGHGGLFGERTELIFAVLSGVMLAAGWLIGQRVDGLIPLGFYGAAYLFGGYFTLREALENLRKRRFEIDTLMLVAAVGAATLGEWAEGALLLFLFSMGHALEHYAMGRARRAIEALAELAPERATVRRGETLEDVAVGDLQIGDVVLVRPNERIAADGVVVAGNSSVNQAPVTGESVPVDKAPVAERSLDFAKAGAEHRVFAGTINGTGALDILVARKSSESTLARVVKMVAEAEAQRSPTQRFTDRFGRIFVPIVLVGVSLLMLAFLVIDEPFSASFYRAMAVLVAASPCALAISVPSAVLSGVARAGRGGVLVKGGGPLENLGTLTAIAFDKTGTLTMGDPRLTDISPAQGINEGELLAVAVAVEALSDHPLAAAVVRDGGAKLGDQPRLAAGEVQSLTGQGVQAQVAGQTTVIGKPGLFAGLERGRPPQAVLDEARRLETSGRTVVMVRHGERYLGVLGLMDTARPAAKTVIARLRAQGVKKIVMLSGDNQSVADAIAGELGLDAARGGLMPEDKVEVIRALIAEHGKVAMIGDGVNDAPAMANATVGVAMGAAGSDVALETADIALMADDLSHLPFAVGLSRTTSKIIKQNLWVSLGVVALLIPATLFGLRIGVAVLFHEGSTLLVVANALRLLAYKDKAA